MKLCIHCVHFLDHPDSKDPKYGLCEASPKSYSPVTGEIEKNHDFCSTYRISGCGMKARFFVPILGLDPEHQVANELPEAQVFPITFAKPTAWVGLTDREFEETTHGMEDLEDIWKAIEDKLKEKNNV